MRSQKYCLNLDDRRPQDHDEDRREDAEYEGEDQLDRCRERSLLSPLAAADTHLVGLHPQHTRNGDTELIRLDERQDERVEVIDVGAVGQVPKRLVPTDPDPRLLEGARELPRQLAGPRRRPDSPAGPGDVVRLRAGPGSTIWRVNRECF